MHIRNETSGSLVAPGDTKLYDKVWQQKLQCRQLNFVQRSNEKISIIEIYVDDLIIAYSSSEDTKSISTFLNESFSVKELGKLHNCMGVKIDRDRPNGQMFLSQKAYMWNVERLVEKLGLTDCKPCYTQSRMVVFTNPMRHVASSIHIVRRLGRPCILCCAPGLV
jgi:hypothetical protein